MSKEGAIIFALNDSSCALPWRKHLWWHSGKHYSFDVQNRGERKRETKGTCFCILTEQADGQCSAQRLYFTVCTIKVKWQYYWMCLSKWNHHRKPYRELLMFLHFWTYWTQICPYSLFSMRLVCTSGPSQFHLSAQTHCKLAWEAVCFVGKWSEKSVCKEVKWQTITSTVENISTHSMWWQCQASIKTQTW